MMPPRTGVDVRTLPFSEPPLPGESLVGFVARCAAKHGISRVATALLPAGIVTTVPEAVATTHADRAAQVAAVLRTTEAEVKLRTHPILLSPSGAALTFDFFGVPIRAAYRETMRRRVSPRGLADRPFHRAAWALRPFSFCAQARDGLVDACPACGKGLGWRWTVGVDACEHCGHDLRDAPSAPLECEGAGLDLVCGLVHHDPARRERARAWVATPLRASGPGDLFEFAVALACAATTDADAPRGIMRRMRNLEDFARLTPEALAAAGDVMLRWPAALHDLADQVRAKSDQRAGHYGIRKELGPLSYLCHDRILNPDLRSALKSEIDVNMGRAAVPLRRVETRVGDRLLPLRTAAAEYGIDPRRLAAVARRADVDAIRASGARSPVLLPTDLLSELAQAKADACLPLFARKRLGIDAEGVNKLADAGLIRRIDGPAEDVVGKGYLSRASLERLAADVDRAASTLPMPKSAVRLSKAVKRAAVPDVPWPALFGAILDGSMPIHRHPSPDNYAVTTNYAVASAADIVDCFDATNLDLTRTTSKLGRVNTHEAAAMLGTSEVRVSALISDGLLATNGSTSWKLDRATVALFGERFALTNEVAAALGCRWRDVRDRLAAAGVTPAHELSAGRGMVWLRADVTALMPRIRERTITSAPAKPPEDE